MAAPPIAVMWDGEAFKPLPRFHNVAKAHFGEGEVMTFVQHEERSMASHGHFFAAVTEAWRNLPEAMGERYPDADTLRKDALIRTGYRDEREIVCASKAEALRVAAFIRGGQGYSVVVVSGAVVTEYVAKSQSMKAMGKEAFAASKDAVLTYLAELIGVTTEQLSQAKAA